MKFFISYKWERFTESALEMAEIARSREYQVWIDRENLPADGLSDAELATRLKAALADCDYVIFFETYTKMAVVMNGPNVRVESWQEKELRMSEAQRMIVLYHGQNPRGLTLGRNRIVCTYKSLDEAMSLVEKGIAEPDLFVTQESPCPDQGGDGGGLKARTATG